MPRILVIDDSVSALKVTELILCAAGYEVVACREGKRAMELLRPGAFDLILTDIYMPDEDGLRIIREGRRLCPDVPIVAMSGMTGKGDMLRVAKYLGARAALRKPVSKTDLLEAIRGILGTAPGGVRNRQPAAPPRAPQAPEAGPEAVEGVQTDQVG